MLGSCLGGGILTNFFLARGIRIPWFYLRLGVVVVADVPRGVLLPRVIDSRNGGYGLAFSSMLEFSLSFVILILVGLLSKQSILQPTL